MRLAGILTLYNDLHAKEIKIDEINKGVCLLEFYLTEALRLSGAQKVNKYLELADETLQFIRKNKRKIFPLTEMYQKGPRRIRCSQTARKVMRILEEHSWIRQIEGGMKLNGKFFQEVWVCDYD